MNVYYYYRLAPTIVQKDLCAKLFFVEKINKIFVCKSKGNIELEFLV